MHKMYKYYLPFLCCLFLFSFQLSAQETDLRLGEWKSHLPYGYGGYCTQTEDDVFFSTGWAVVGIDKLDFSKTFLSKVDGLSDVETGLIKYDEFNDALIVTYINGNMDVVRDNGITNFSAIKDSEILGSKAIRDIYVESASKTYLAIGSIFKEFNIEREEFGDETNTGVEINNITTYNGLIYIATEEGIYRIENDGNTNIQDFSNWEFLDIDQGFPGVYSTKTFATFNDKLYLDVNDTLFTYDGQQLDSVFYDTTYSIKYINNEGPHLMVGMSACIPNDDCDCVGNCTENSTGQTLIFDTDESFTTNTDLCISRPEFALEDQHGQFWYGDRFRNIRIQEVGKDECQRLEINSPYTIHSIDMVAENGELHVVTEVVKAASGSPVFNDAGIFVLEDNTWKIFNRKTNSYLFDKNLLAFYKVAVNPETNESFYGTMWDGILNINTDKSFTHYGQDNSILQVSADPNRVRVTGLAFDDERHLWIANHTAQNPIALLKNDGNLVNNFEIPHKALRHLIIDQAGYKWFTIDGSTQGLLVFDEGEDLDDPADDRFRVISTNNSILETNVIKSMAVDLDGSVWVGTSAGVYIFECGSNVFDANCQGARRIVDEGGFNGFLLETEDVRSIAIDGANRKWFGTTNGLFVQSPNGEENIAYFDEDNSPLFSNLINALAIDKSTGEVFIGTSKGLLSFRGPAQHGGVIHDAQVYAYPNPVRPDYTGDIAIRGLARDANVKITDVNGQLIYETTALGGQAIWDGKDYNGRKASTGVYLVLSTTNPRRQLENPLTVVTRILVVN